MTTSLEWRERAAEAAFVRADKADVLGRRVGIEALARWAADNFGFDEPGRAAYVAAIMARFLAGADVTDIVLRVRTDLERAGKPALSTHADAVFSRAEADATPRHPDCASTPRRNVPRSEVVQGPGRTGGHTQGSRRRIV